MRRFVRHYHHHYLGCPTRASHLRVHINSDSMQSSWLICHTIQTHMESSICDNLNGTKMKRHMWRTWLVGRPHFQRYISNLSGSDKKKEGFPPKATHRKLPHICTFMHIICTHRSTWIWISCKHVTYSSSSSQVSLNKNNVSTER